LPYLLGSHRQFRLLLEALKLIFSYYMKYIIFNLASMSREINDKENESMMFHEKHQFTLHGSKIFDLLLAQEKFQHMNFFKRQYVALI